MIRALVCRRCKGLIFSAANNDHVVVGGRRPEPARRAAVLTRLRYLTLYVIISRCRMKFVPVQTYRGMARAGDGGGTSGGGRQRGAMGRGNAEGRKREREGADCGQYSWQRVIRLCRFMTAARISSQFRSAVLRALPRTLPAKSFEYRRDILSNTWSKFHGNSCPLISRLSSGSRRRIRLSRTETSPSPESSNAPHRPRPQVRDVGNIVYFREIKRHTRYTRARARVMLLGGSRRF